MLEGPPAESEDRVKFQGQPAGLVPPVFEQRLTGLQQGFRQRRIEPFQARQQHDGMTARTGHGHGVQLQITEPLDHTMRRPTRSPGQTGGPTGHPGPFGFEQTGPGQRQPSGLCQVDGFHAAL